MTVRALKAGAANFLTKPFDDEELLNAIQQCLSWHRGEEIRCAENFGNMVGESPGFQRVLNAIQVVAPTEAAVLIEGETGTGKELVAHAIHDRSSRSRRSFIEVNCAAIPATLLESELFGHEKGAFTGRSLKKWGALNGRIKAPCFSTRLAKSRWNSSPNCCGPFRSRSLNAWGVTAPFGWTSGLSPRQIGISSRWWIKGSSGATCIIV